MLSSRAGKNCKGPPTWPVALEENTKLVDIILDTIMMHSYSLQNISAPTLYQLFSSQIGFSNL